MVGVALGVLTGCNQSDLQSLAPVSNSTLVTQYINDTPYAYTGTSCWIDKVRTNGPSYGASGNSRYSCTGGGGDYGPYPGNDTNEVGFYRDGTVSFRDPSGNVAVYTVLKIASNIPCELLLLDNNSLATYDLTPVNFPGVPSEVLDGSNHVAYLEAQHYQIPGDNTSMDSGSIWTCSLSQ
jgi:hypothetical protein